MTHDKILRPLDTSVTQGIPGDKQSWIDHYVSVRNYSLLICEKLAVEDFAVQPTAEVSPPKWHLGHTSWFFEELILRKNQPNYCRFDDSFPQLFNSYYKSAGKHWLQAERGHLSRPTVAQISEYRSHVDQAMIRLIDRYNFDEATLALLDIGLQHEQQHQELLLMDIKFILGANPLRPVYTDSPLPLSPLVTTKWCSFDEGIYDIGAEDDGFQFDNETPRHKTYIHAFAISDALVTNGEFLEFINDGGYQQAKLWLSMGWDWLHENHKKHPLYWYQKDKQWFEFTLHGPQPLDMNAPVAHISYYEANAYAMWRGCRLPTEQEFELYLRQVDRSNAENNTVCHPHNANMSAGQLWCWTQSHYSPYPGYQPYQGMLEEYNGKFMCNQFVLRGGCVATPPGHYRPTYRNFYQPHQQWMFSGIRLAKDEK